MKNFFKNKNVGFSKFKSKHKNFFYTTNNQKESIRFENQKLIKYKLEKLGKALIKIDRFFLSSKVLVIAEA